MCLLKWTDLSRRPRVYRIYARHMWVGVPFGEIWRFVLLDLNKSKVDARAQSILHSMPPFCPLDSEQVIVCILLQRLRVRMTTSIPRRVLTLENTGKQLEKGSCIELPLWMAAPLIHQYKQLHVMFPPEDSLYYFQLRHFPQE